MHDDSATGVDGQQWRFAELLEIAAEFTQREDELAGGVLDGSGHGAGGYSAWRGLGACPISHLLERFERSVERVTRNLITE